MKSTRTTWGWRSAVAVAAVTMVLSAFAVQAQEAPVTVTVNISGNAVPNGLVTARAMVEIMDGSTLQSYAWTQTGGLEATINGGNSATASVRLGPTWRYRRVLFQVLAEPPITEAQLPPNVPAPEGEFVGGTQSRWGILGVNPFSLEEAGLVTLEVDVTTSSGTYSAEAEIHTTLPWQPAAGIRNVPVGVPVLLNHKEQGSYDWQITPPAGSSVSLVPQQRFQEFTPDVTGIYTVRVTDEETAMPVVFEVYVGTWRGVIVAQDDDGRPVAEGLCTACHGSMLFDENPFEPWAQTGHAEIFTDLLNTNTHYSSACWSCHTVGYNPGVDNGGFDDAPDFPAFLDAGLLNNPGDNWTMVLEEFPATAQLANVQCENCHGPASSEPRLDTLAHGWRAEVTGEPRVSLSSDVCAVCHGEPLRHARFQQWQLSAHANYELAVDEGGSGNCARCHTVNGFLKWLPVLTGEEPGDPTASITVDWAEDESHPQTCVTCHDPHDVGTVSGIETNAILRIQGTTPPLIAGFQVVGAGRGAICMTCHNSRRGLHNDSNFAQSKLDGDATRAPHGSSQTDVLMGENAYLVNVGVRGRHSLIEDSCVTCHMEVTPPPEDLSYNQGGTNHTFFASADVCTECHTGITADGLQTVVGAVADYVQGLIEDGYRDLIGDLAAAGNTIDLGGGTMITSAGQITGIAFSESRGRQAIIVTLAGGATVGPVALNGIDVIQPAPMPVVALDELASDALLKAGWNWMLVHNDGSRGAHNPTFVLSVLDGARDALGGSGGPRAVLPDVF